MNLHPPAIEVSDLTKAFGRSYVLRSLSMCVREGETVALMGSNGAGKTTLLRCIAGNVRPNAGAIRCFGADMTEPAVRGMLGSLGHDSQLYPYLTLAENLRFAARMYAVSDPNGKARRWLAQLGLSPYADRLPNQVSRGMRQRVSLARASIHDPRILLFDEPSTGLDAQGRRDLLELLADLKSQRRTLCLATHDRSIAAAADRILTIEAGKIAREENVAGDLRTRDASRQAA